MVPLKRRLNRIDALAITLSAVIGVGVFRNTGLVLHNAGGFVEATVLWLVVGVLCLGGASLYADLSGRVPEVGGQYAYVRVAFGGRAAFIYGWLNAGVAIPARQATTVAVTVEVLSPWVPLPQRPLAIALLLVLAVLTLGGIRAGAIGQRIFTVGKLAAIAIVVGLAISLGGRESVGYESLEPASFAAAVGAVWYTYLGWQDVVVLAEEVKEPRRALPFVLFGTVLLTMVLYMAIHVTVYVALGGGEEAYGKLPALEVARHALGDTGENLLRGLMLWSMVGVAAIGVLLRPRIAMALARDGLGPRPLTKVSSVGTPYVALSLHVFIALVLVSTGSYKQLLQLISFAMGVMGLFEIASYFVVRRKRPELPTSRLHPWGPIAFLIMSGALCGLGAYSNPMGVLTSFGIIAAIALLYAMTRPKLITPEVPPPGATAGP
ncbi:MAG: amino acid permease [Myxococcales bacterium]|nr:amino acid permease [Myxococcales bacterium]